MIDNNSQIPPNPLPPNQNSNTPPHYVYDRNQETRKTLYLVAFIFSIITTVWTGITGIVFLITGTSLTSSAPVHEPFTGIVTATFWIIFGVILLGIMAWAIIATILINRFRLQIGKEEEQSHLAFSICVLIFGNLISGILLTVASCLMPSKPRF